MVFIEFLELTLLDPPVIANGGLEYLPCFASDFILAFCVIVPSSEIT
jgi:hypothetical protein